MFHDHPWKIFYKASGYTVSLCLSCRFLTCGYGYSIKPPHFRAASLRNQVPDLPRHFREWPGGTILGSYEPGRLGFVICLFPLSYTMSIWKHWFSFDSITYQCIEINSVTWLSTGRTLFELLKSKFEKQYEPEDRYTRYIFRLLIDDADLAQKILPFCSNLESLALWAPSNAVTQAMLQPIFSPTALPFPHLQRLSICWKFLPPEHRSFSHPIFQGLTHLDINYSAQVSWSGLSSLENLIYFQLDCISAIQEEDEAGVLFVTIIETVASHLPKNLEVCLVVLQHVVYRHLTSSHDLPARRLFDDITEGRYEAPVLLSHSNVLANIPLGLHREERFFMHTIWTMFFVIETWTSLREGHFDFWMSAKEGMDELKRQARTVVRWPSPCLQHAFWQPLPMIRTPLNAFNLWMNNQEMTVVY